MKSAVEQLFLFGCRTTKKKGGGAISRYRMYAVAVFFGQISFQTHVSLIIQQRFFKCLKNAFKKKRRIFLSVFYRLLSTKCLFFYKHTKFLNQKKYLTRFHQKRFFFTKEINFFLVFLKRKFSIGQNIEKFPKGFL